MKERQPLEGRPAPGSRRTARAAKRPAKAPAEGKPAKAPGWLTPKRALVLGAAAIVAVGGGGFTVYTAVQNASTPPQEPVPLDVLAEAFGGGDPFGPDPAADALKAQAVQALAADALKRKRQGRKPLDPIEIADTAPGGGGFDPQQLPPGTANPTGNKALGKQMLEARGWGDQWGCLEKLWMKESGWNERAMNRSSGAYGIPQSLPGHKMASAGADWQTNAATQIEWGLTYIKGRYGTPCGAWAHSQQKGWY
ncbi:lytic transglycosylase domain-containing protein [Planomonospora sp. ID67723]|uniref:aggregation-promoting factor C-terminal-like domain-containing protein n=1 Tax=Planomonospora sp. ID67723 TaxID=2738134 RepID=UPI001A35723D|nr:lytic transglycosylase domain-containing protein [Planomonospora sp. ID67723]MBG0826218.1 lytic transglycosylase domain-containing protein [Planomonospora sp. ID67723]